MINWGVIGAGGIAYRRTIPEGISKSKNSKLVAITDINLDFARKISSEYEVKLYNNEEDLINDKTIDAVYIATPVFLHHRQCILAAKKGKHIFCEKIMALNEKQCTEMIDACKSNNVKLAIAYMMRFNSIHKKIREMVKNGVLGKIVLGRAQLSCWYPPIEDAWRQKKDLGGGGSLADMGSHCIDLLEFIFDSDVKEVSCFTGNFVHDYQTEDTSIVTCKFEKEALGIIDNCFNIPDYSSKNILEIYGSRGSILCKDTIGQGSNGIAEVYIEEKDKEYDASQKNKKSGEPVTLKVIPTNTYQAEIEYFANCIENNIEPEISGELGLHNIKIIEGCYKSAKELKVIEIN